MSCVRCGSKADADVLLMIGMDVRLKYSGEGKGYMLNSNGKRECYHHSMICDECADDFMREWCRAKQRVEERKTAPSSLSITHFDADEADDFLFASNNTDESVDIKPAGEFKDAEFDNPDDYENCNNSD